MPSIPGFSKGPTVPKPEPTRTYVCLVGYIGSAGAYAPGVRLRGDHDAVIAHPQFWILETADDLERRCVFLQRFPEYVGGPT